MATIHKPQFFRVKMAIVGSRRQVRLKRRHGIALWLSFSFLLTIRVRMPGLHFGDSEPAALFETSFSVSRFQRYSYYQNSEKNF